MRVEWMGQLPQPERAKRKGIPDALLPSEQKRFVIRLNMLPEFDAVRA